MKRMLTLALLLLTFCAGNAAAQRTINERHAMVPDGFVRIFLLAGSVNVIGWDKDSLAVTGTVWEPPGDRFGVGITPRGAKMGLWSDVAENVKPSNITVYLPRRSQVWVKTTDADTRVSAVAGGIDLFSVSGSMYITGAPSEVYAETMGGEITLSGNTQSARIKTAAGALHVSGSIADLTAVTVSGPVDVVKTSFARARIESVDGDIRFTGPLPARSMLEVTNHAGAIDLYLPAKSSASFAISLYEGKVVDEFGNVGKYAAGQPFKARELKFALGSAPSAQVTIRSFKGRVALRKR
ncbi:MAG TPA: DUF4097 family beta strand repeat-containing protein [Longimicrobiales bacterium]